MKPKCVPINFMVTEKGGTHILKKRDVWLNVDAANDAQGVDEGELDPFN